MIIKNKEPATEDLRGLRKTLARRSLAPARRGEIEGELARLEAEDLGRREAAYHIDLILGQSKDWAVIHDLRLENHGCAARIDHLLIGRYFDIFVIGSRYYKTPLRLDAQGDLQIDRGQGWSGMQSPIEQNKRQIIVLNRLITEAKLMPTRLGLPIRPTFRNWVLVSPDCLAPRRSSEEAILLKMIMFQRKLDEFTERAGAERDVLSLPKIVSSGTIRDFAHRLAGFHSPEPPVIQERPSGGRHAAVSARKRPACAMCGAAVEPKMAAFCRYHSGRFGKRILCESCQANVPAGARILRSVRPRAEKSRGERNPQARPGAVDR